MSLRPPCTPLAHTLEALYARTRPWERIPHDPVRAVHRYPHPLDQEVAGFLAAGFAFGRVDLFLPVIDALLDHLDHSGGPRSAALRWRPSDDARLTGLGYRWIRDRDLGVVIGALGRALTPDHSLEDRLGDHGDLRPRLGALIDHLTDAALAEGRQRGQAWRCREDLPRGVRTFLPDPRAGSACKRLNLWVRWMVRPPTEGVDRGLWRRLSPKDLLIPVDTHVGRLARFIGLTQRTDASWRTAQEITDALRALDPDDPVRFDFAIAHLGISKACRGVRDEGVCPTCPLDPICRAPEEATSRRAR